MRSAAAALVLAAILPASASAQVGAAKGPWYTVFGLGKAEYSSDFPQTSATISATGATAFQVDDYNRSTAWKLMVGYRLNARLAAEVGYWSLGETSYKAQVTAPVVTEFERKMRTMGVVADLVYVHPFNERLAGLAKAGVLFSRVEAYETVPGGGLARMPAQVLHARDPHLGLGLRYAIDRDIDARFEYDYFKGVGDDVTRLSAANVHVFMLSVGYNF